VEGIALRGESVVAASPVKTCARCKEAKPISDFTRDSTRPDKLNRYCRVCRANAAREYTARNKAKLKAAAAAYYLANTAKVEARIRRWRLANAEDVKAQRDANNRRHAAEARARGDSLKTPCVLCGDNYLPAIDFHHLDPATKAGQPSDLRRRRAGALEAEVENCICLCANCHRKFHGGHPETVELVDALRRMTEEG
jgi:hypothetical protein